MGTVIGGHVARNRRASPEWRKSAAVILLVVASIAGCAGPMPIGSPTARPASDSPPTPTPGPGDPLPNREPAIARAIAVAEIVGPFAVTEAIRGTLAALDPFARNDISDPPPSEWPGSTEVWRVTLQGPTGSTSIVLTGQGDLVGSITQGH